MSSKNKKEKKRNYLEVEKVEKAPHCLGKKCNRFAMFRQSCDIKSCFYYSDDDKKKILIEDLAEKISKISPE